MPMHSASSRSFSVPITILTSVGLLLLLYFGPRLGVKRPNTHSSNELAPHTARVEKGNAFTSIAENASPLMRRDDYSCGTGKPCANGACCGAGGFCGYGTTYCGTGCVSNCNAVAECGKDASPAGKTCPLNTCCSQYGFCGTTSDFCGTKCQSNCVLHPKPPGNGGGDILKKVIGYYESWSARLPCHRTSPADLPLDALTHLNYAFAYIDPSSFSLVTMDQQTPESLFQEVADVKKYKSNLKVWVSVGGWTFSDNGTSTQSVFGNIAASAANRQKFADNVVKFLNHYGFDGIDIDWEYPGAPDRGGHKEDTQNYVSLLQTLRSTFDTSPRGLGISFTAPSSYWYLRWFDLPSLIKYADWINMMTYDLHGVWDRNNPIGSIVQAHTNLTEIGYATELLWRVKIPPSKVVMGFGFYGRSFQLSSSSCTTPGCQFSGGANAGPCSDTSGILMYYEIMAMLRQHTTLTPVWDKAAAVKYVVFDSNQWVSYDDADTFKQKVDWANTQGLGGALIWASDTDDDKYSAHSGLVGRTVAHVDVTAQAFQADPGAIAQNLIGQNGQDCKISPDCTDQNNPQASGCGSDTKVGWERGNCGKKYARSICCPAATAPKSCTWRGSGGDCNGQCHPGESTLFGSSWGGFPTESNQNKCSRGYKVFCCDAGDWKDVIAGCRWTGCGGSCNADEDEVSQEFNGDTCTIFQSPYLKYCCPRPASLYDCTWRGSQPDCPDAKCQSDEVAIALHPQGRGILGCSWGRQKTDCCKVKAPPPPPLTCDISLCDFDSGLCDISDDDAFGAVKRDIFGRNTNTLEARGRGRKFPFHLVGLADLIRRARPYPSRGQLFATQAGLRDVLRRWFRMRYNRCDDTTVEEPTLDLTNLPRTGETEHPIDLSIHTRFVQAANTGRLPSGQRTRTAAIGSNFFQNTYFADNTLPVNLPRVTPGGPDIRNPYLRVFEAFGSNTNRGNFILTDRQINGAKGALFVLNAPIESSRFRALVERGTGGDTQATEEFIQELRIAVSVFRYLQNADVAQRFQNTRDLVRSQLQILDSNLVGAGSLTAHWDEFFPDYMRQIQDFAQQWVTDRIADVRRIYGQVGPSPRNRPSVLLALIQLENQIASMTIP